MMKTILAAAALAGIFTTMTAHAESEVDVAKPDPGFYLGGALGRGGVQVDVDGFGEIFDEQKLGYKLFAGWRFSEHFSLEGAWADLQRYRISDAGVSFSAKPTYLAGSAIRVLPLKPNFALFGRLGLARWDVKARLGDSVNTFSGSDSGNEFIWGAGALCYLDGAIVRLEYEKLGDAQTTLLEENDTHMDFELLSLGVAWKF